MGALPRCSRVAAAEQRDVPANPVVASCNLQDLQSLLQCALPGMRLNAVCLYSDVNLGIDQETQIGISYDGDGDGDGDILRLGRGRGHLTPGTGTATLVSITPAGRTGGQSASEQEHSSTRAEEYMSIVVHGMLKMSCLMCNAQCQAGEPSDMRATSVRRREKKGRRSGVVGDGDGEPSAMLVLTQCGALPCRAAQRSADCRQQ